MHVLLSVPAAGRDDRAVRAANQAASAGNRANIINLMGKTQTGAAGELASSGQNLLGQGIQGAQAGFGEAQTMQQQMAKMWNDIIKDSAAVAGGAMGGLPGNAGGAMDVGSNMLGAMG